MASITFIVCSIVLLAVASPILGKRYERCELARELLKVHKFPLNEIGQWVCLVQGESNYDTSAINTSSGDHGLFQISQLFWCSPGGANVCNIECSSLRNDDITDDVRCVRQIFAVHGFSAWVAWRNFCQGRDVSSYTKDCNL